MSDPFDFDNDGVVSDEEEEEGFLLFMDVDDDEDEERGRVPRSAGCLTVLMVIAALVLLTAIIL